MSPPEAVGKNLRNARKSLGMTQVEVSSVLGMSRSAISLIETGKRRINSTEVALLANLYHKTISALLDAEISAAENGFSMLFRAKEISKKDRIQIVEFEDLCKRYAGLEKRIYGRLSKWEVPSYSRPNSRLKYYERRRFAADIAEKERRRLDLGIAPIKDIFSLLEKQGVRIFNLPLSSKVSGSSTYSEELGPCILINANHDIRRVFTATHEYFHCLVDRDVIANICVNISRKRNQARKESIAEYFAECFLMPSKSVTESYYVYVGYGNKADATDVVLLSTDFGVSYSAMLVKLKNLKLITESDYTELGKARPESIAEELGLPKQELLGPLPGKYVHMATKLYFREEISIGKLAEYLKVGILEVQGFVKDLRDRGFAG